MGVLDYFREISCLNGPEDEKTDFRPDRALFEQIAAHEEALSDVLLGFLGSQPGIRIIGESLADRHLRVPTISFVADRYNSDEIVTRVDPHRIGIRFGDFYARRLINDLGLSAKNGVVRVSMVHYNTMEEVKRLIAVLERILM
jgi:selenocysteine lyase/cysteine desulfurase